MLIYKNRELKLNDHYEQFTAYRGSLFTSGKLLKSFADYMNYTEYVRISTQNLVTGDKKQFVLPKKIKTRRSLKRLGRFLARAYIAYTCIRRVLLSELLLNIFVISSSLKQYKPYMVGFNYKYYRYFSVGSLLKKEGLLEKNLKKSKKATKLLFNNIKYIFKLGAPYMIFLRPLNKRNYKLLKFIQKESNSLPNTSIGFLNYYNTIFRKIRRIKKNIKKRLLHSERNIMSMSI